MTSHPYGVKAILAVQAGRENMEDYNENLLTEQQPKTADEARAVVWELQRQGKISIHEAVERAAAIRLAWDPPAKTNSAPIWMDRRRLLTERKNSAALAVSAAPATLRTSNIQLNRMVTGGRCTVEQADNVYKIRCSL